jgi:hypothetical protein
MPGGLPETALAQVLGSQRRIRRTLLDLIDQRGDALRAQHHVVVQKHQPRRRATTLAGVSPARDRVATAAIVGRARALDSMNDQLHVVLIAKSAFHVGVQFPIVSRHNHDIDRPGHRIGFHCLRATLSSPTIADIYG